MKIFHPIHHVYFSLTTSYRSGVFVLLLLAVANSWSQSTITFFKLIPDPYVWQILARVQEQKRQKEEVEAAVKV